MIAYAAIDIRDGRVVQLIGGRPERERLSLPDPVAVAAGFTAAGFKALHLVDLDAALGEGSNRPLIEAVIGSTEIPVQVGGGIRNRAAVAAWLEVGAARVIVGTRAVTDPSWLAEVAAEHPERIVVAADVDGEQVVSHGWTRSTGLPVGDFLGRLTGLPIGGLLVTDVSREGRLEGVDARLFQRLAMSTALPVVAAGGVSSIDDLRQLEAAGARGAVVGTALYTGGVDPVATAKEFNS
jgi:phosphoribosylformimino-5-aminoimidazole carboxamide ribotide isomerase